MEKMQDTSRKMVTSLSLIILLHFTSSCKRTPDGSRIQGSARHKD